MLIGKRGNKPGLIRASGTGSDGPWYSGRGLFIIERGGDRCVHPDPGAVQGG